MNIKNKSLQLWNWIKPRAKRAYQFWFVNKINEERLRELKAEHLKYYRPYMRM